MPEKISDNQIMHRVKNLIQNNQTMTLATTGNNHAWAAPVFYLHKGHGFYFFSNPTARHIQEAMASGQAACTIYHEASSWENLMGLQMSGKILTVTGTLEASKAILGYVTKFPVVKTFFSGIKDLDLTDFSGKFHATLYCFLPDFVFFMDNSIEFGFRTEIKTELLKDTLLT